MKKAIWAGIAAIILVCLMVGNWTDGLNFQNVGENTESQGAYEEWKSTQLAETDTEVKEASQETESSDSNTDLAKNSAGETMQASGVVTNSKVSGKRNASGSTKVSTGDASTSDSGNGYYGALQVKNGKLCGEDGNPVQLKGVSTHGLAWYPEYVNEDAIAFMHDTWGINVLRLALYTTNSGGYCVTDEGTQADLLETIDKGVKASTENEMYAIIDWHILEDGNPLTYIGRAKTFWETMSKKYADNDHVLYEICNEPNGDTTWAQVKEYAETIIPIIRANDKNAVIIVGTPNWSQDVDTAAADPITIDDNVVYALHFYAGTHKAALREKAQKAIDAGLPLFVSEYSICDASGSGECNISEANKWISFLDENDISYVQWNLSNKGESSSLIKANCFDTTDWTESDLTESGKWLVEMLGGN